MRKIVVLLLPCVFGAPCANAYSLTEDEQTVFEDESQKVPPVSRPSKKKKPGTTSITLSGYMNRSVRWADNGGASRWMIDDPYTVCAPSDRKPLPQGDAKEKK